MWDWLKSKLRTLAGAVVILAILASILGAVLDLIAPVLYIASAVAVVVLILLSAIRHHQGW